MSPGDQVAAFDEAVDGAFDRLRGDPVADRLFYGASAIGDFSVLWLFLGSLRGLRSERHADEGLRLLACLAAESALVNQGIKRLLPRRRPRHEDVEHPHALRTPQTTSFPSGHASSAFLAASLLSEGSRGPARVGWFGLATVVACSRIHVRVRHGSDVVADAALGLALGAVAKRLWRLPR